MKELKNMPIWRDANRFLLSIENVVKLFPRYHKYTLETELRNNGLKICNLIHQASQQKNEQSVFLLQLKTFTKQLISDNQQKKTQTLNLSPLLIAQITATIASYIGHFKHASSLKLITGLWQSTPWLNDLLYFDKSCYQLCPKYSPIKIMSFQQQVLFFRHHYPQAKLKIQLRKTTQVFLPTSSLITQTLIVNQKAFNQRGICHRKVTQIINFNQGNNHE